MRKCSLDVTQPNVSLNLCHPTYRSLSCSFTWKSWWKQVFSSLFYICDRAVGYILYGFKAPDGRWADHRTGHAESCIRQWLQSVYILQLYNPRDPNNNIATMCNLSLQRTWCKSGYTATDCLVCVCVCVCVWGGGGVFFSGQKEASFFTPCVTWV